MVIANAFLHLEAEDRARRLGLYDLLLEDNGLHRWADRLLRLMSVEGHPAIVRGFRRSLRRLDPGHIRRVFREQIDWDQRPDLPRILCPVLVVQGRKDDFIPTYCPTAILRGLSNSELAVMDAGHLPYLETPAAFNRAVSKFLSKNLL